LTIYSAKILRGSIILAERDWSIGVVFYSRLQQNHAIGWRDGSK
jgi:hypothetical protein